MKSDEPTTFSYDEFPSPLRRASWSEFFDSHRPTHSADLRQKAGRSLNATVQFQTLENSAHPLATNGFPLENHACHPPSQASRLHAKHAGANFPIERKFKAICQNGMLHKSLAKNALQFPLANLHQFWIKIERKEDNGLSAIVAMHAAKRLPSTETIDEPFALAPLVGEGSCEVRTGPALRPGTAQSRNAAIHWAAPNRLLHWRPLDVRVVAPVRWGLLNIVARHGRTVGEFV